MGFGKPVIRLYMFTYSISSAIKCCIHMWGKWSMNFLFVVSHSWPNMSVNWIGWTICCRFHGNSKFKHFFEKQHTKFHSWTTYQGFARCDKTIYVNTFLRLSEHINNIKDLYWSGFLSMERIQFIFISCALILILSWKGAFRLFQSLSKVCRLCNFYSKWFSSAKFATVQNTAEIVQSNGGYPV